MMIDEDEMYVLEDDDNYYSDAAMDMERNAEEDKLIIELGRMQGRWDRHEEMLEKEEIGETKILKERSADEKVAEMRQIFDSKTAFRMLSKELIDIMK